MVKDKVFEPELKKGFFLISLNREYSRGGGNPVVIAEQKHILL